MPITLHLEPDEQDEPDEMSSECELSLLRGVTATGLPGVVISLGEGRLATFVTLREFLAAARGLRAKAEMWPEWQAADTP